jgi:hypothetical protein
LPLFLFFRWKVHLCCRSCSLLVAARAQPSIQNNFTLFPRSAILFLFLTCTSNFFLSRVLKLTTAIYYIYHIC